MYVSCNLKTYRTLFFLSEQPKGRRERHLPRKQNVSQRIREGPWWRANEKCTCRGKNKTQKDASRGREGGLEGATCGKKTPKKSQNKEGKKAPLPSPLTDQRGKFRFAMAIVMVNFVAISSEFIVWGNQNTPPPKNLLTFPTTSRCMCCKVKCSSVQLVH